MPSTARSQLVTSIQSWATLLQLTLKIPLHTKIQQFLPEVVLSPCDNLPFYKHPPYTFCNRPILKCSPTNQNPRSPICSKSTPGALTISPFHQQFSYFIRQTLKMFYVFKYICLIGTRHTDDGRNRWCLGQPYYNPCVITKSNQSYKNPVLFHEAFDSLT